MEPYAYDLFSSANTPAFIWGGAIILTGIVLGILPFFPLGKRDFLAWTSFIVCVAVGGLIGWGVGRDIIASNNNEARIANLIEQAEDVYDVTLTEEQAAEFEPPLGTPLASYEEFGKGEVEFMGSAVPVILVWNEGVMFFAVEGTDSSLPTKEQMEQQQEQAEQAPADSEAPTE